jgi:hypothetical protein
VVAAPGELRCESELLRDALSLLLRDDPALRGVDRLGLVREETVGRVFDPPTV